MAGSSLNDEMGSDIKNQSLSTRSPRGVLYPESVGLSRSGGRQTAARTISRDYAGRYTSIAGKIDEKINQLSLIKGQQQV